MMRIRRNLAALPAVLAAAVVFIQTPVYAAETEPGLMSEEEYLAEDPSEDPAVRREKYYLLEAMDRLEDAGLSPILIWSKVTKNEKILDTVNSVGRDALDSVTDVVTEKVQEAGDAVAEKAGEAVQEQTQKVKKSLLEMIREQIRGFFEGFDRKEEE